MNIYQKALMSQSACNLSGLVYSLGEILDEIRKEPEYQRIGTDYLNSHPVVQLFIAQMLWLTALDTMDIETYVRAHKLCTERSETCLSKT